MDRSQYHKEYRKKREDIVNAKLDRILELLEGNTYAAQQPKPKILSDRRLKISDDARAEMRERSKDKPLPSEIGPFTNSEDVKKALSPLLGAPAPIPICCLCGVPATHTWDLRFFCQKHHGRDATPL